MNISNISERKNAERLIAEREELFHFLADNMVDATVIFDTDERILFGNRAAVKMSGLGSGKELSRIHVRDFLDYDDLSESITYSRQLPVNGSGTFQATYHIHTFDGKNLWVEGLGEKISFQGDPATIVTFRDVTLQKQREYTTGIQRDLGIALASLSSVERASELSLDAAMKVAGMNCGGLYLLDTETEKFVPACSSNLSETAKEAAYSYTNDSERILHLLSGKQIFSDDECPECVCGNGQNGDNSGACGIIPIMNKSEVIGCFYVASETMTEIPADNRAQLETIAAQVGNAITRIQAEVSSNEDRKKLQMLFNSLDDFLIVSDKEGKILYTNPVVAERLGYTEYELLKMSIFDLHSPNKHDVVQAIFDEVRKGLRYFSEPPFMTKDGVEIPVETKITISEWGSKFAAFAISRDISHRISTEKSLRRHDAILDAVRFSAGHFLGDSAWDSHIADVLKRLGEATESSRSYIFRNYTDSNSGLLHFSFVDAWNADGVMVLPKENGMSDIPYRDTFTNWQECFSAGNPVKGNISKFPVQVREHLEQMGILSLLAVPVFAGSQLWGFIGFDDCVHEREWTQTEIDALQAAAGIIGSAIHRTQTDEVFRNPVEKSLVCTYIVQDDGIRYINPRGAEMFGYERDFLIDSQYSLIVHPEDLAVVEEHIRERLSGEVDSAHYEFRGIRKSGEEIICEAYGTPILYMGSFAIVGMLMDVTERKKAEKRIKHLHQVILAVRNVNELIVREKDSDHLVEKVCRTLTETRGYQSASIFLFDGEDIICWTSEMGSDDAFIQQVKKMQITDLMPCCNEVLMSSEVSVTLDPASICTNLWFNPQFEGHGQMCVRLEHEGEIYGLLTISLPRDLAYDPEEKAMFVEVADDIGFALHSIALENEQREAEKELRIKDNAISSAISGIVIFDLNGNVTYVNDASVGLWGYDSADEMLGKAMSTLLAKKDQGNDLLTNLYDKGRYIGEITAKKKDGSSFLGQAHSSVITDVGGHPVCLMASVVDITEKKRAEEALRYSENLYRTIFGNSGTALALVEDDGLISLGNATLEKLFGYPLSEVEGKLKWDAFVVQKDQSDISAIFSHADGKSELFSCQTEAEMRDKWGNPLYGIISVDRIPGTKQHVISFVDITELKNYENQIKDSLDEKSVMLMEIHHRVKNNLQIVSGLIKLQALSLGDDAAVAYLKECENRIMTMSLVHESLYQSDNLAEINAREHLQRLASNILRSETDTSQISLAVDVDDISINLDTAIPCSLIVNELLTNCIKYAFVDDKSGTIRIELHRDDAGMISLVVADDGCGLSPDFDIRTAHSLGLQLVTRLLKSQLKGTIEICGENGTKFALKFPEKKES